LLAQSTTLLADATEAPMPIVVEATTARAMTDFRIMNFLLLGSDFTQFEVTFYGTGATEHCLAGPLFVTPNEDTRTSSN
jgi:hypothetical protein